jgi:hypothetical protein
MSLLSKAQLRELVEERGRYCVSIFMPTHRRGREVRQDPIRLKNLVAHAEAKLVEAGMRGPDAKELLKPAQDLLDMPGFWRRQSDGLALFLSEDSLHQFRLPLDFEPMVTVGESYHIRPLLPLLMRDARFYLLALSQNEVRLLEATQDSVEQVELEQVPDSLDEALRWDDPERQLQWEECGRPSFMDTELPVPMIPRSTSDASFGRSTRVCSKLSVVSKSLWSSPGLTTFSTSTEGSIAIPTLSKR